MRHMTQSRKRLKWEAEDDITQVGETSTDRAKKLDTEEFGKRTNIREFHSER